MVNNCEVVTYPKLSQKHPHENVTGQTFNNHQLCSEKIKR